MTPDTERLYNLLPALYRYRDQQRGEPLRALLSVIERELQELEAGIDATYANWFIQTCDEWAIPYIADLLAVRDAGWEKRILSSQRRLVGNTIAYRRRKGTLAALEHALADGTGWAVAAVEFGRTLAMTQHLNALRPDIGRTADLRDLGAIADPDGPFADLAFAGEARLIELEPSGRRRDALAKPPPRRRGKRNLPNTGIFVWRLFSFSITGNEARAVDGAPGSAAAPRQYTFHPLGLEQPLFARPEPPVLVSDRIMPVNVPCPISRALLEADLQEYRNRHGHKPEDARPGSTTWFGKGRSIDVRYEKVGRELADGKGWAVEEAPVRPSEIVVMDLSGKEFSPAPTGKKIALDPETGRLLWLDGNVRPGTLRVDYSYGGSAELGGGPYRRGREDDAPCVIAVARNTEIDSLELALWLWGETVRRWAEAGGRPAHLNPNLNAVIRILDSGIYRGKVEVRLPPAARLAIVAENGARPAIAGGIDIFVEGATGAMELDGSALSLNGLLVGGPVRLDPPAETDGSSSRDDGAPARPAALDIRLEHCTLAPLGAAPSFSGNHAGVLRLTLDRCITGALRLPPGKVSIVRSIVDGGEACAIGGPEGSDARADAVVTLDQVTVFGSISVAGLDARDCLITGPADAGNLKVTNSLINRHLRAGAGLGAAVAAEFTSRRYGDPGYAQLSLNCDPRVLGGAADGSEVGAFHDGYRLQAEQDLAALVDEYLPLGLSAGVFYVT